MRRYQVLIESDFPSELGGCSRTWRTRATRGARTPRTAWTGPRSWTSRCRCSTASSPPETEYLFWVGCAGAFDDGAKKTMRAVAELLHRAGVKYVVLGPEETCTGDPARRSGNEFLFQMLAAAERRGAQRGVRGPRAGHAQDRHDLPALLQHAGPRVPAAGRPLRGRAPHAAAEQAGARGQAGAGRRARREPTSPTTTRATWAGTTRSTRSRASWSGRRRDADRDAAARRPLDVLRRRWRPHVDGGADRQADQRHPHRGGHRTRPGSVAGGAATRRHDRRRLPVLPHHAHRRPHPEAGRRCAARASRSRTSRRCCWPRSSAATRPPTAAAAAGDTAPTTSTPATDDHRGRRRRAERRQRARQRAGGEARHGVARQLRGRAGR